MACRRRTLDGRAGRPLTSRSTGKARGRGGTGQAGGEALGRARPDLRSDGLQPEIAFT